MRLKISAKPKNGFWRCKVHHPSEPVIHPAGKFTEKEIKILKDENMLVVEELPDEEPAPKTTTKTDENKKAAGDDKADDKASKTNKSNKTK